MANIPSNYTVLSGGIVRGPGGATYHPTNARDANGFTIYRRHTQNGDAVSEYYVFNGQRTRVESPNRIANHTTGFVAERTVAGELRNAGLRPVGTRNVDPRGDFESGLAGWRGRNGIDGIYTRTRADGQTEYIIVEVKGTQSGSAGGLSSTNNGTQLSTQWITRNLNDQVTNGTLSSADRDRIIDALESGRVTRVKANVTGVSAGGGTNTQSGGNATYQVVNPSGSSGVTIGGNWTP